MTRLLSALRGSHPRHHPSLDALADDPKALVGRHDLHLVTDDGQVDLHDEVAGVGDYDAVAAHALELDLGSVRCKVIGLDDLIRCKRAIGRPKDLRTALELEAIRQLR
jgi:hypothetical protein